jgi:hypothetical protein
MKNFITYAVASYACASLSKQMWNSAEKIAEDSLARDQVFKAVSRVFKNIQPNQKETVINNFYRYTRIGSIVSGGISLVFALNVIKLFSR